MKSKATYETWEDFINSGLVRKKTKQEELLDISVSLRADARERQDTDISLVALEKLRELGFNNTLGTLYLANIIEDLYSERILLKSSREDKYFDLSSPDNEHFKYLVERYRIKDENYYRGAVAIAISRAKYESKNINEIAYKVLDSIINTKTKSLKANLNQVV